MASLARLRGGLGPPVAVVSAFVLSRLAVYLAGVRFDTDPLGRYFQFVDPDLLEHHLVESLWYLHSQPPLFNASLGVVLKASGSHSTGAFAVLYLLVGLALALALYGLLVALDFRPWVAAGLAALYTVTPPVLVLENWLFYDYPVIALLVGSALALHWFVERPSALRGLLFFGLIGALVLTRSVFQLAWIVLVAALVALAVAPRRLVVAGAVVPVALVIGVYVKNAVEFGTFTTSSWYGMSLAATTLDEIPRDERVELVRRGDLSRLALTYPFSPLEAFPASYTLQTPSGHPVLDRARYGPTMRNNYNHLAYIPISEQYFRDWRWTVRHRPSAYVDGVTNGMRVFFDPTTSLRAFRRKGNPAELGEWHDLYTRVLFSTKDVRIRISVIRALFVLTLLSAALRLPFWLRDRRLSLATRTTLAYVALAVAYAVVVWVATDNAETFRARETVQPFVLFVLLPFAVRDVASLVKLRRR